jgi:hypothetical protein
MKTIGNFGAFVCETWWAWVLLLGAGLYSVILYNAPKTVTLDSKHWSCTMAVPDGIGSRCIEYVAKEKIK